MGCSDSLTSLPPHFVAFVWQYRVCARYSLPGEGSAPSWVLGLFTGCPPGIERGEIRASQVPGGPPCMRAPLCDPDRPPASGQSWRERCCLPPGSRRRPWQFGSYEAESRGPHARCLRFAASVTRNTTQDSLPAGGQPLLGGVSPAGSQRKVSSHIMAFPLSQALLGARTILPSGPLSAIASFGSSEGHSLSVGPFDRVSLARKNMDAHLRGHAMRACELSSRMRTSTTAFSSTLPIGPSPSLCVSGLATRLVRGRTPPRSSTSAARWLQSCAPGSASRVSAWCRRREAVRSGHEWDLCCAA